VIVRSASSGLKVAAGTVGTTGAIVAGGLFEAAMSDHVSPMTAAAAMASSRQLWREKLSDALTKARVDNLRAVIGAGGNASNLPITLSSRVADPGPYLASNCAAVSGCCLRHWIASEATSTRG
jgi:hypothetical protein